ncbi:DUF551 domain-containing protein [Citrobacter portucalensis]|uniref:DUF551 domain-containing protein n=1 Tax=Citrobacter portucalensis TaxID=1639133 RepID=UPI00202CF49B|nr:DUF551 domain-containing protein [Citrobacter portucalensis]URR14360.1 DUF551 domain-containing protein [Citrobacter portucalensis]
MKTNNHPAHGPVSLKRLHQIREILSKASAQSDGGNLGYAMADAVKVIDVAIAAFGAELAPCPKCNDTGMADSGGVQPWGEPIFIECDCRAAMLQGIQPVSNRDELPLGYLQGHKDGLEWAAQLAEANHPQTGDWLYDDPIDLAKAIRKGPHMPELKLVPADADDNFYSWFGRFWHENYQQNNYTTSAKQMLGTMAEFAFRAGRESAAQASNSPVTPDTWIPVSERMPEVGVKVLCFPVEDEPIHAVFNGQLWLQDISWSNSDEPIDNAITCNVTHWMPLPAAPKREADNG